MKRIITFAIAFLCCYNLQAQDMVLAKLYASLMKQYNRFQPDTSIDKQSAYFFSILIRTGNKGEIVYLEKNIAADTIFQRNINHAFDNIDKKLLQEADYKNKALIIPFFLFRTAPQLELKLDTEELINLWTFKDRDGAASAKVLPPIIMYVDGRRSFGIAN